MGKEEMTKRMQMQQVCMMCRWFVFWIMVPACSSFKLPSLAIDLPTFSTYGRIFRSFRKA